jgi:Flp pilus assembly protein TadG
MKKVLSLIQLFPRFRRNESGVALVEFAILLPMLLLVFAVIIEGGRLMWSYQSAAAGVRDATRYLARVAPLDICFSGAPINVYTSDLETIVGERLGGAAVFPTGITVTSVTPGLTCDTSGTYRISPTPVAQVTAALTVTFPFSSVFSLFGSTLGTINTTISDQSRVFGT